MQLTLLLGHLLLAALLLAACNNTYGPPSANGKPQNYGQQRYLDNQRYQQQTQDRMNIDGLH